MKSSQKRQQFLNCLQLFRAEHKSSSEEFQRDAEWTRHRIEMKSSASKHELMLVDKTALFTLIGFKLATASQENYLSQR